MAEDWQAAKDERLVPYGETNLGLPVTLMRDLITPTELFFVRSNYPIPELDARTWRLRVDGLVDRPLELSIDDLRSMPSRTITAFLECAGNSRTRLDPPVDGTPWRDDAVGNAVWTGVPLRHVLDLAGLRSGAVDVVSQGGDDPRMRRGLPLAVARRADTLLVWEMNGEPLRQAHGSPLRLMVPGWGGIASTKWLIGLTVIGERFEGYWNSDKYVLVAPTGEELGRVEEMPVKSIITVPAEGDRLAAGPITIRGFAWSGTGPVDRVEVSVDAQPYRRADIVERRGDRSWVRWASTWTVPEGPHVLTARAFDALGNAQPTEEPWNAQGYQVNAVQRISVLVERAIPAET